MVEFSQRIKDLEKKAQAVSNLLKQTGQRVKKLESEKHLSQEQIRIKEQELERLNQQLETLQQERNQIKKEIKEKVEQLEASQLTHADKQAQINRLLTEHSQELEEVDKLLYDERSHYRQIRDKLISKLCEPCPVCQSYEKEIKEKNRKIIYFFGLIALTLILFFLFHLWLFGVALPKYIKRRIKEIKYLKI